MDRKTFLCIFFLWFSLCFREITYAKNVKFTSSYLCCSFVERKTTEPFCFSNIFCIRYFLKTKRKSAKKYREMFSYPFVAHMPKLGKSEQKLKKQPKFQHRPCPSIIIVSLLVAEELLEALHAVLPLLGGLFVRIQTCCHQMLC